MTEKKVMVCSFCGNEIIKEKYVLLGTYDDKKTMNETFFHFNCYVKFYNEKVKEKAMNYLKSLKEKSLGMLQNLQGVAGSGLLGNIGNMFESKINDVELQVEDKLKKKKENDRKLK